MIPNRKGCKAKIHGQWHYLAVKKLSTLIRWITSKHCIIVWIVFILLEQKNLELHKEVCENKDTCNVIMPFEDTKILQFNQYQKSDKVPFIIYADLADV